MSYLPLEGRETTADVFLVKMVRGRKEGGGRRVEMMVRVKLSTSPPSCSGSDQLNSTTVDSFPSLF
jgi:hypothetical protein